MSAGIEDITPDQRERAERAVKHIQQDLDDGIEWVRDTIKSWGAGELVSDEAEQLAVFSYLLASKMRDPIRTRLLLAAALVRLARAD